MQEMKKHMAANSLHCVEAALKKYKAQPYPQVEVEKLERSKVGEGRSGGCCGRQEVEQKIEVRKVMEDTVTPLDGMVDKVWRKIEDMKGEMEELKYPEFSVPAEFEAEPEGRKLKPNVQSVVKAISAAGDSEEEIVDALSGLAFAYTPPGLVKNLDGVSCLVDLSFLETAEQRLAALGPSQRAGRNPLHAAAVCGESGIIENYLKWTSEKDFAAACRQQDKDGNLPLHHAVSNALLGRRMLTSARRLKPGLEPGVVVIICVARGGQSIVPG